MCKNIITAIVVLFYIANIQAQSNPVETEFRESFVAEKMRFALTGDAIITRPISPFKEPQFLKMIKLIHGADVAFTNLEMLFHNYEGYPATHSGGTYMRAEPELIDELVWAGFDMVSMANNHTMDFGPQGLESTIEVVRKSGLVYAGAGMNLAEARAPSYMETDGGRVAIISVASSFSDEDRAGHQRKDMKGRPGLSPIRYKTTYTVSEKALEELKMIAKEAAINTKEKDGALSFLNGTFKSGTATGIKTEPHIGDLEEILRVIQDSARQADWVLVTSHTHESKGEKEIPAEFLEIFARATIDAGADIFVGHGPHVLRGIEIYEEKPIFYSLGDFLFQNETVALLPADLYERYEVDQDSLPVFLQDKRIEAGGDKSFPANANIWESVIAVPEYNQGQLTKILLHPITLGFGESRTHRGRPRLASVKLGKEIITTGLAELSKPYGTEIKYDQKSNTGIITIP